ncbi:MAG: RcpC/CpaB family pilus assembly protein [Archangium sp.]|nr:RcpC/CpaB family pilus assembly protein [Archangium sp.]
MKSLVVVVASVLAAAPPAPPEPRPGLEVMAKARAFTLDTSAVGGAVVLRAGDHVDLVAVVTDPESRRMVSVTLLQNVIVIANAAPAPGEPRQLSLLLIPEEVEILAFAKQAGHLTASLRNPADLDVLEERGAATMATITSGERTSYAKPRKK